MQEGEGGSAMMGLDPDGLGRRDVLVTGGGTCVRSHVRYAACQVA